MAQQIQFIYLTQSDYDNLTPQTSKIYFTSDTHRIYKGSDLYAATTFDQLNFSLIEASSITVDGDPVSVEGHTHIMSEITDLDTTAFASSNHTHPELSGITQSAITKDTGTFTNLVVTNASLDATSITASGVEVNGGIQASAVSASSAIFQSLTVTGEVTMSLSSVDFQNINASSLTVNGSAVSLEGHSHFASEISGLDAAISTATSNFALSNHTHPELSGLTSSTITKETGTFTNLVVASASFTATNVEAEEISASTATFGDINVTGTATLSTTNIAASTLIAGAGSFTTLTVGGSDVSLEGHTHSEYASISHSHAISDITDLQAILSGITESSIVKEMASFSHIDVATALFEATTISANAITVGGVDVALEGHSHSEYASASHGHAISEITDLSGILSGITSSSIEKDTVTADIGYFRLLSVSGSANFAVNTVSANAVTVNGTDVALSGHTHSVADIDGLSTTLNGFASSGHTHEELMGITQTSISKTDANFTTVTANAGTFNTLTTTDLNLTNLSISSASVSSITVTNLNVTNTLKLNNKDIATQEYVQAMISQAIGQVLASAY